MVLNRAKKNPTSKVRLLKRYNDSHPQLRSASSQCHKQVSWLLALVRTPAFPSRFTGTVTILRGVDHTSYSGATAPVSHRLPFSAPISRDHLWTVIRFLNGASAKLRS